VQSQRQQPGPQQWGKHDYTQAPAGFAGDWESLTEGARWKEWAKDSVRRQNDLKLTQLQRFPAQRNAILSDDEKKKYELTNRLLSDQKTAAFWNTRLQEHLNQQPPGAAPAPDVAALQGQASAQPGGARYWAGRVISQAGGALANDKRSAPESGFGRGLHRVVQGVGTIGEAGGTIQDYGELGFAGANAGIAGYNALNDLAGSDAVGALPNYTGMAAVDIGGVAQADMGALTSFKKHFGILNQAIGRGILEGDPNLKSQVGRHERQDAMWQDAIGNRLLMRARKANAADPTKAEMGNPRLWRSAARRLLAKDRLGRTMEAHGMRSQQMLTQQESAAILGAQRFAEGGNREAILRTPNAQGQVLTSAGVEQASANPSNLLPAHVEEPSAGQRIGAATADLFSGVGHALQGHSGRRALLEGNNLGAGAMAVAGMAHAAGDAVFSAGMSEVPVVGQLTNATYAVGTYAAGAIPRAIGKGVGAIGGSSRAVELHRRDAVRKRFAGALDETKPEIAEGPRKGALNLGDQPTPWQEEVRQRGMYLRPQAHAEQDEIAEQKPLTRQQLDDAAQGINVAGSAGVRKGRYRGNVADRDQLKLQATSTEPVNLPEGKLETGKASDQEAGWSSRKRGWWSRSWRAVKRAWRGSKPGRFFSRLGRRNRRP